MTFGPALVAGSYEVVVDLDTCATFNREGCVDSYEVDPSISRTEVVVYLIICGAVRWDVSVF